LINSNIQLNPLKALKDEVFEKYCALEEKAALQGEDSLKVKEQKELNRLRKLMVREFNDYLNIYD
jgi:hypothetical protein